MPRLRDARTLAEEVSMLTAVPHGDFTTDKEFADVLTDLVREAQMEALEFAADLAMYGDIWEVPCGHDGYAHQGDEEAEIRCATAATLRGEIERIKVK